MRAFIVLCLAAVTSADSLGYNYQPHGNSNGDLSLASDVDGANFASKGQIPASHYSTNNVAAVNDRLISTSHDSGSITGFAKDHSVSTSPYSASESASPYFANNAALTNDFSNSGSPYPSNNAGLANERPNPNLAYFAKNTGIANDHPSTASEYSEGLAKQHSIPTSSFSGNNAGLVKDHSISTSPYSGNESGLENDSPTSGTSFPAQVEVAKEFYTFSAPESEFIDPNSVQRASETLKQGLRVIFIKGPENKALEDAALALAKQASQQQTAVYVLNKQTDIGDLAHKLNAVSKNVNNKPEVHFVKYRTDEDAVYAQNAIQSQYDDLGGDSKSISGGVAPVLNFASRTAAREPNAQLPKNSYLPSSVFRYRN